MSIYDKPVRLLLRDMVEELAIKDDQVIARDAVHRWFNERYPKVKQGTISAHLLKMSTNAQSRVHYNVSAEGDDDLLFQIESRTFRLYDPAKDPEPIYSTTGDDGRIDDTDLEDDAEDNKFAYEKDLQHFLAKHLSIIEKGLALYEDEGISGTEFPAGDRRIDILAVDRAGDFVVVELKVAKGYDRVTGQLLRYMAWIRKHHADPGQKVRGIIVAREISEDLRLACSEISGVDLYEYALSVTLTKVSPAYADTTF